MMMTDDDLMGLATLRFLEVLHLRDSFEETLQDSH